MWLTPEKLYSNLLGVIMATKMLSKKPKIVINEETELKENEVNETEVNQAEPKKVEPMKDDPNKKARNTIK